MNKQINNSSSWKEITPGGTICAPGNSAEFVTGDWRSLKPIIDESKCKHCLLCLPVCPDSALTVVDNVRQPINYDACKGCGICAEVCAFKAIKMVKEDK
ncbi:MAG: 4Fe-4S binding protein [Desulfovibrionales bacterium]|nr:4Fe-4S binding protein [Desulfovibrionales bacterium]